MKKLIINTDGGSRGNPGDAAYGFVIRDSSQEIIFREGGYLGITTNNVAEYTALQKSLETALKMNGTDIVLQLDSELIVRQMTGIYRIKEPTLQTIAAEVKKLLSKFASYEFHHVRREFNKDADSEVNKALDNHLGLKN